MIRKQSFYTVAGVVAVYLLVAAVTGLDWPLFRDEGMYIEGASRTQAEFPAITFWMNINAVGVLLSAVLFEWVGESIALLRMSVLLLAVIGFWLFTRVATRVPGVHPGRSLLLLALIPEVFLYAYQLNGAQVTLFGVMAACVVILDRQQRGASVGRDALLLGVLSWVCVQSPFCLSFLPAAILSEFADRRQRGGTLAEQLPVRTTVVAVLAFAVWVLFILLNGTGLSESLERHSVGENPAIAGLHFGNWAIFFVLWGGLFPFLAGATAGAAPLRCVLPFVAAVVTLGYCTLPANGYAFAVEFHTIYTMAMDRAAGALGWSPQLVSAGYFTLLALGAYAFANFWVVAWRSPRSRFFLLLLVCYMVLMLVDGFVASRLFLPGWVAMVLFVERAFHGKPRLFAAQLGYQALVTVVYSVALSYKYEMFG